MIRQGRFPPSRFASGAISHSYLEKVLGIAPNNLVALWPLSESAGTVAYDLSGHAYNGIYDNSVILAQVGIGDGGNSTLMVPAIGAVNVYSAPLAAAFNGQEGTVMVWFKQRNASVLSDGAGRYCYVLAQDGNNQTYLSRTATNNQYNFVYVAGGVVRVVNFSSSSVAWQVAHATWSKVGDAYKVYLNATQQGVTQTGLGTYVGSLVNGNAFIGHGGSNMDGYEAYCGLWNIPLNQTQITALATVP